MKIDRITPDPGLTVDQMAAFRLTNAIENAEHYIRKNASRLHDYSNQAYLDDTPLHEYAQIRRTLRLRLPSLRIRQERLKRVYNRLRITQRFIDEYLLHGHQDEHQR